MCAVRTCERTFLSGNRLLCCVIVFEQYKVRGHHCVILFFPLCRYLTRLCVGPLCHVHCVDIGMCIIHVLFLFGCLWGRVSVGECVSLCPAWLSAGRNAGGVPACLSVSLPVGLPACLSSFSVSVLRLFCVYYVYMAIPVPTQRFVWLPRLQFPQLALRRRLGQLSCMSRPALRLRSWPLSFLYYFLTFGALKPLAKVGWRPTSRVSTFLITSYYSVFLSLSVCV